MLIHHSSRKLNLKNNSLMTKTSEIDTSSENFPSPKNLDDRDIKLQQQMKQARLDTEHSTITTDTLNAHHKRR